jgi:hypothetical protein
MGNAKIMNLAPVALTASLVFSDGNLGHNAPLHSIEFPKFYKHSLHVPTRPD